MILQATEGDILAIVSILDEASGWLESRGLPLWERESLQWSELSRFHRLDQFYLAFADGEAVGCMALMDHDPHFWPSIPKGEARFIHKLAVRRAAAGKGVSTALIQYAVEHCREQGVSTLRLDCHRERKRLRRFYEQQGFACVGEGKPFSGYEAAYYMMNIE